MAGNTLIGGIGALIFLGSCFVGKPLTQIVSDRVQPAHDEQGASSPGEREFKHRVHVALSAMWGIGLLVGMAVSLVIIFGMPVDVANAVNTVVSLGLTAVLIVATVLVAKRARAKWEIARTQSREQT